MTRFILIVIVAVLIYWLFRRLRRSFLEGLNPGSRNVRPSKGSAPKEIYRDVQDAEFKDISKDDPTRDR